MNLSHQTASIWLQLERDGRLDETSHQALVQHLAECPACRSSRELAGELERKADRWPGGRPPFRTTDRQLVRLILQARRRKQIVWEPLKGLAWAAALALLVILLSWSIQSLLPGGFSDLICLAQAVRFDCQGRLRGMDLTGYIGVQLTGRLRPA